MAAESEVGRSEFRVWETVLVRWADMDSMGHINNARYFTFCESARMRYFEAIDMQSERQLGPAIVTATCNFRRQGFYPATLEVGVRASRLGGRSFTLEYGIFVQNSEQLLADGSSVVVWVDYAAQEALPIPAQLRQQIEELDGLTGETSR